MHPWEVTQRVSQSGGPLLLSGPCPCPSVATAYGGPPRCNETTSYNALLQYCLQELHNVNNRPSVATAYGGPPRCNETPSYNALLQYCIRELQNVNNRPGLPIHAHTRTVSHSKHTSDVILNHLQEYTIFQ